MDKKKNSRSGFSFYKEKGLEKALLIHLSKETHKKLRRRAFMNELSIQKTVRQIIDEAVKNEPLI
jgi:hypothetical protein